MAQLRPRQRLAIQLAAGAEREAVGHDIADRHHVRRQTLLQRLMQHGGIQRHARLGDQPGDQLAHIGAAKPRRALAQLDGVHRRLRYPRLRQQRLLDFPQLDALAADLQLIVAAP